MESRNISLLAWVCLVSSWFVDEKYEKGSRAVFLILPKAFAYVCPIRILTMQRHEAV